MSKFLFSGAIARTLSLLFLLSGVALCPTLSAQDRTAGQQSEEPSAELTKDDSILMELRTIRELQQEAQLRREKIRAEVEKRDAGQRDTASFAMSDEYGAILQVEDNTRPHWYSDGWNLFGIFTFIVALISAYYACITYKAQKNTELHTTNAPIGVQLSTLKDLPRHFYRNLVCTCAMILKFKFGEQQGKVYPSEGNMKKLQTLPDDVVLPIDVDTDKEDNAYQHMHELRLLLRNYNVEVEVASEHVARKGILEETLAQDFGNLLYKPLFLIRKTFNFKRSLNKGSLPDDYQVQYVLEAISSMTKEHFNKLLEAANFRCLFKEDTINYLTKIMPQGEVNLSTIDKGGDILRSVEFLLKYTGDTINPDVQTIQRKAAVTEKASAILSINDAEEFTQFCLTKDFIKAGEEPKAAALYPHLAPYLNYLYNPTWDTVTILQYILAIDAAIETNRIGMVNYK